VAMDLMSVELTGLTTRIDLPHAQPKARSRPLRGAGAGGRCVSTGAETDRARSEEARILGTPVKPHRQPMLSEIQVPGCLSYLCGRITSV
jgi:hypothetical protein